MVDRWRRAPWWVVAVVVGVVYGAVVAVQRILMDGESWSRALGGGAVSAAVFGPVMGWVLTRQRDRAVAVLGDLDADGRRRAVRAVTRGPVPLDPDVRAAALRLAGHHLESLRGQRPWAVPMFTVLVVVSVLGGLAWSPWYWGAAALFAIVLVGSLWQARRLQRRLAVLGTEPQVP